MTPAPALVTPKDFRFGAISLALHLAGGMALLLSGGAQSPTTSSLPVPSFQLVVPPQPVMALPVAQPKPPERKTANPRPVLTQTPTAVPLAPASQETAANTDPALPSLASASPIASQPANPGAIDIFQQVTYLDRSMPLYPASARKRGIEGRVLLQVEVDAAGLPVLIRLVESSGSEALDRAALDAVRQWKFKPARRANHPIAATVTIPIHFRLDSVAVAATLEKEAAQ